MIIIESGLRVPTWAWLVLAATVGVSLLIDLWGHRGDRATSRRAAVTWSIVWVSLGLAFSGFVFMLLGRDAAEDYVTAFLVEKSLSVDNLFVFLLVFGALEIPTKEQHRVLLWGIIGAFVVRGAFIAAGVALLDAWHGIVYGLGAFLVYTGIKTARQTPGEASGDGRIQSFLKRHVPLTDGLRGHRFTVVEKGRRLATPLLLALIWIEATDIVFAIDSIPAVFAVTDNPFIVYSSNVFAILGLRALYLVLADLLKDLKYLHFGIASILVFTGAKMLSSHLVDVPHWVSLLTILGALGISVAVSLMARRRAKGNMEAAPEANPTPEPLDGRAPKANEMV